MAQGHGEFNPLLEIGLGLFGVGLGFTIALSLALTPARTCASIDSRPPMLSRSGGGGAWLG